MGPHLAKLDSLQRRRSRINRMRKSQHGGLGAAKVGKGSLEALRSVLTKSLEKKQLQKDAFAHGRCGHQKSVSKAYKKIV